MAISKLEKEKILYSQLALACRRATNKTVKERLRTRCAAMRVKWAKEA